MPVHLSIIIVNYRSGELTRQCIQKITEETSAVDFEIIVVDNLSNDNSKETICNAHPSVVWHQMNYNAGFARANNAGIKLSKGRVVLLLNPDTIVINNAIERCYSRFVSSSFIACSVQLLNEDGTPQISGNYFMKGGLNHLLPLPYWGAFLKTIALVLKTKKPNVPEASNEEKVDWINGAFLMVKKEAIEKAGYLDEDFFLYAEEAEWCSRLRKAGDLVIFGDIRMIHLQGETVNTATETNDKGYSNIFDRKGLQLIVSNHVRIRKQYGVGWFLFQLLNFTVSVPIFLICSFIKNIFYFQNPFSEWKKIKGLAVNVFEVWKLTPVILSNKPHFYKML